MYLVPAPSSRFKGFSGFWMTVYINNHNNHRSLGCSRSLQGRPWQSSLRTEASGDLQAALGAIREARGSLELLAKMLGMMKSTERPAVAVVNFRIGKGYDG